jgi:SPP1 family predicted phage head-tail adaptor
MKLSPSGRIARKSVRIIFQMNDVYSDRYKNRLQQWTDYFECNAYANTFVSNEDGEPVKREEQKVTFECRWCPELDSVTSTKYRILFRGDHYNILSVDPMNYQKRTIRFICEREVR